MTLTLRDISKAFGGLVALDRVSLEVGDGAIVSIIGPNGAGKTTLFNVLTGLYRPDGGTVRFGPRDITGLPPERVAAMGIGRTFQNIRLFGAMTVFENVMIGLHARIGYGYADAILRTPRFGRGERDARARALELLAYTGLKPRASDLARHLSYGEQRRLEIARALALQPSLLLLDEPAAGMNPREADDLTGFLRRLRDDRGLALLLIEHHMQVVMRISDRVAVLDYGRKIAEGTPAEVRADPDVIEAYLGRSGRRAAEEGVAP